MNARETKTTNRTMRRRGLVALLLSAALLAASAAPAALGPVRPACQAGVPGCGG
jgi:hypothetical protein